jgi:molybdopterin-guanine dinucleotide biosynthesis protein A
MRGVILAGGAASRFGGQPKGLTRIDGVRILDRVSAACLEAFGRAPLLIANAPDAATWAPELEVVADLVSGAGPLGGLLTAVECGPAPVVVVAWDMPFVTASLLRRLGIGLEQADVCVPESDGPRGFEPLCAAYGAACGPPIRAALARGDHRMAAFHAGLRISRLPRDEVARSGDPQQLFRNINTPDDLAQAQRPLDASPP